MRPLETYLRALVTGLAVRPRAICVVSAHWEEAVPTLMTAAHPPMLYDYYGFPAAAYTLQWPAPTSTEFVARARALLEAAGFRPANDGARGYDHGTFVPMMLAVPHADISVVQVSLLRSLDPAEHLALGRALAPLREEGVLLIGSGSSYHNMRGFGQPSSEAPSRTFDAWIGEAAAQDPAARERLLVDWEKAPFARACHPREEHLLPLHVMAGAALGDAGTVPFHGMAAGVWFSAVQFG
jgi:aromatic ring-opening dioxygenase catalytic subunit (LigB family)